MGYGGAVFVTEVKDRELEENDVRSLFSRDD